MADDTPNLMPEKKLAWYQGLSRYQWWVLVIASMGWMFDTMDQQFFNLGRGKAMQTVLNVDPIPHGLQILGDDLQLIYSPPDVNALVADGTITQEQADRALYDSKGKPRHRIKRVTLATAVGVDHPDLIKRYRELGIEFVSGEGKGLKDFPGESFDRDALERLVESKIMTTQQADKYLAGNDGKPVSRDELSVLVGQQVAKDKTSSAGNESTTIFIFGWAIGGLFFGWVGDSLGRAKTMAITILTYAICTGLNGLATDEYWFNFWRFLTALGVGGEFAAGAALVAETMPDRSRPAALGALQALSAVGNMMGALLAAVIMPLLGWRYLFFVGALPGLVAVFVFLKLKEPQKWVDARNKWLTERKAGISRKKSSYLGLFQDPRWAKRAIVGLLLGVVGVGGLWGVGFFTPELNRSIAEQQNYSEDEAEFFVSMAFFLQQFGAFLGISAYTWISLKMGRRPAFAFFFIAAFIVVSYTFLQADTITEAYILGPLVGFVTLGPFGGYAIYFPELFPTRLRSTGVGFCYNVGRFLAAGVPKFKDGLRGMLMAGTISLPLLGSAAGDAMKAVRYGSFLMIFIYILGLFVLLFAPETKGQPLPED